MNAASIGVHALRPMILERRSRLRSAAGPVPQEYLQELLAEVDAALARIDNGSYGRCDTCHDAIEPDRLERDPLTRFCVDHLGPAELRAHQQDLDLATRIQARLLPREVPLAEWDTQYVYRPVGAVGGDYCELIPSGDAGSLFFAVGDVAGKGVAASLLMTHLSAIFRSLLTLDLPLDEVVTRANRLFCDSTSAEHYATLACGRTTALGLDLCNAGHCPPLVLRKGVADRVEATGMPLGLFCGVPYSVRHVSVEPGDWIALYTDGITEARNGDGDDYGENRLIAALRTKPLGAKQLAENVLGDVSTFRGTAAQEDDMTLLIVGRIG